MCVKSARTRLVTHGGAVKLTSTYVTYGTCTYVYADVAAKDTNFRIQIMLWGRKLKCCLYICARSPATAPARLRRPARKRGNLPKGWTKFRLPRRLISPLHSTLTHVSFFANWQRTPMGGNTTLANHPARGASIQESGHQRWDCTDRSE